MKRKQKRTALALLMALALLPLEGIAGLAEGETEEIVAADEALEEMPGEADDLMPEPLEAEPTEAPSTTASPEKKSDRTPWLTSYNYPKDKIDFENEIWAILTGKWGLKDYQAAGLMSSIQAESSFCPYNAQGGGPDDRGKYEYKTVMLMVHQ